MMVCLGLSTLAATLSTTSKKELNSDLASESSAPITKEATDSINGDSIVANTTDKHQEVKITPYEQGKATYYGRKWHGRKGSSGERLDMNGYQCAHKTLPFGTLVKVTNKNNGKSCIVKVIDRGPFGKGKVIDLTYQAASDLDMISAGVVPVKLEIVESGKQAM